MTFIWMHHPEIETLIRLVLLFFIEGEHGVKNFEFVGQHLWVCKYKVANIPFVILQQTNKSQARKSIIFRCVPGSINSHYFNIIGDKLINPVVGVYRAPL